MKCKTRMSLIGTEIFGHMEIDTTDNEQLVSSYMEHTVKIFFPL